MSASIFQSLQRCADAHALRHELFAYFVDKGFGAIAFTFPSRIQPNGLFFVEHGFPGEWIARYRDKRMDQHDPIPNFVIASGRAQTWHDVDFQPGLTTVERQVVAEIKGGTTNGIMIPTYGRSHSVGIISIGETVDNAAIHDADLPLFQAVAQQAHARLDQIEYEAAPAPALSPRERQIMFWIAHHKSNTDIGTILAISPATIATHVKRIFHKLEANDRMTAVKRAVESGQIWV